MLAGGSAGGEKMNAVNSRGERIKKPASELAWKLQQGGCGERVDDVGASLDIERKNPEGNNKLWN